MIFKNRMIITGVFLALLMTGCSSEGLDLKKADVSTTGIYGNGTIEEITIEPFEEEYYQAEEAADYVQQIIDEFNEQNPQPEPETKTDGTQAEESSAVELVSLSKKGKDAKLDIKYRSDDLYNKFNSDSIKVMTMTQAVSSGLLSEFDDLADEKNGGSIAVDTVLGMQDVMVVKTVKSHHIMTEGKILYHSDNAVVSGNTADTPDEEAAIIIFRTKTAYY